MSLTFTKLPDCVTKLSKGLYRGTVNEIPDSTSKKALESNLELTTETALY